MGIFKINANRLEWINGPKDDPEDLCLHGHVTVQVGMNTFSNYGTVSASA